MGTLISALIVGFTMYALGTVGLAHPLKLIEAFSFGSLISATDPVSTLALFSSMNADQDLYAIVFGESVLNDAVSIILTQYVFKSSILLFFLSWSYINVDFTTITLHQISSPANKHPLLDESYIYVL